MAKRGSCFWLSRELLDQLVVVAGKMGVSRSSLVEVVLREQLGVQSYSAATFERWQSDARVADLIKIANSAFGSHGIDVGKG